jgi:hypothetical protein
MIGAFLKLCLTALVSIALYGLTYLIIKTAMIRGPRE